MPKSRKLPGVSRRYVRRAARVLAAAPALAVYLTLPMSTARLIVAAATVATYAAAYVGTAWGLSAVGTAALNRSGK